MVPIVELSMKMRGYMVAEQLAALCTALILSRPAFQAVKTLGFGLVGNRLSRLRLQGVEFVYSNARLSYEFAQKTGAEFIMHRDG
jgi:hypothetical protein